MRGDSKEKKRINLEWVISGKWRRGRKRGWIFRVSSKYTRTKREARKENGHFKFLNFAYARA